MISTMEQRTLASLCFVIGLFLQVLISTNGKQNVKRFSWFFLVPFLLFLIFDFFDPKTHLYDTLGVAALFAIMLFVPFYGKEMLPVVTEQTLLSHTLVFWVVFLMSGSKSAISVIAIPLTLGTLLISFINVRLNLFFKYIFYGWHLIIVISLIIFGGLGKGLRILVDDQASSNSILNTTNPSHMILFGMAGMYLLVNMWYAVVAIFPFLHTYAHFLRGVLTGKFIKEPYDDKNIIEERRKVYRERFSDEQISPSVSINIIIIFGIIFGLNYKLEIVSMFYPVILWFIFAPRMILIPLFSVGSEKGDTSLQKTQVEHKPLPSFIIYPLSIIHGIRQFISPMLMFISRLHTMSKGGLKKLLIAGVGAIFIIEISGLLGVLLFGASIGFLLMILFAVAILILENKLVFFDKNIESKEENWFIFTIVLGWLYVASANSTFFWHNSIYPFGIKLLIGRSVKEISVTDAPKYRNASVFYFRDGIALPVLKGSARGMYSEGGYYKSSPSRRHIITYSVIPVVPDYWKEDEPIPLWLAYQHDSKTGEFMWRPPTTGEPLVIEKWVGITIDPYNKYYYRDAISDSEKKYNIKSHPDAALIYYSETPEIEKSKRISFALLYFLLPKALWVFVTIWRKKEWDK